MSSLCGRPSRGMEPKTRASWLPCSANSVPSSVSSQCFEERCSAEITWTNQNREKFIFSQTGLHQSHADFLYPHFRWLSAGKTHVSKRLKTLHGSDDDLVVYSDAARHIQAVHAAVRLLNMLQKRLYRCGVRHDGNPGAWQRTDMTSHSRTTYNVCGG